MLTVGITGGIGAGKSVVSRILTSMNYPVFNADSEAKKIVDTHPAVREALIDLLGDEIYVESGLNRPLLASIIFSNDTLREKVNAIIHPRVREAFGHFAAHYPNQPVFNEAAILFETGGNTQFSRVILVTADEQIRLKRVMQRDGTTVEQVKARMEKQWPDERKIPLADFVIVNDDKTPLIAQVESVLAVLHQSISS